MESRRQIRRRERLLRVHEFPLLVGLVFTWLALWREISPLSVLSGVFVSILAMRLFYLPPVNLAGRFNLWWSLRYLMFFLWKLSVASVQVAWIAVRPRPLPESSVIAVKLRTTSDFILTMVSLTVSLIPGSLVVEIDRFGSTLYLHVLNAPDQDEIAAVRHEARVIERLLVRAVGSRVEVEAFAG